MDTTLLQRKHPILIFLAALSLSLLTQNIFAAQIQTAVIVGCTVVKNSSAPIKILQTSQQAMSAAELLKDINVKCPTGSAVTMSVQTQSSEQNTPEDLKNCPLPPSRSGGKTSESICPITPHYHFYKDTSCTEIWSPGEKLIFTPDTKHPASAPSVYSKLCKKNPGTVSLKEDESVTILTITLEY